MPSGTLAQQIALRIWCDRAGLATVAMHPTAHPVVHESQSLEFVQRLRVVHAGSAVRLMTPADVAALSEPIAALLVELPQRELGGQLPAWDDLLALVAQARERDARLHLDGARLWQVAPYYGRSHAEIAALFDSVYVSFYKDLDAIAGAALAGDAEFIAHARLWQHRLGGRLVAVYPLALSAEAGFDRYLPKMQTYCELAARIAGELSRLSGVDIVPDPPQTNMFHLYLRGTLETLTERASRLERERGVRPFRRLAPTALSNLWKWEFVVGEATTRFEPAQIAAFVEELVAAE
jgi:threonine aldolase